MADAALPTTTPSTPLRLRKHQIVLLAAGLAVAAAGAFGLRWWQTGRFLIATDNAYVRADVVTISPRVSGIVSEVDVGDNQRVSAGDVLARIDDRDYRAKLRQTEGVVAAAHASISAQQAQVATIDARTTEQENTIAEKAATVAVREADARLANIEFQRQSYLAQQQVASTQKLQSTEAATQRAAAALAEARATLSTTQANLAVLHGERDAAVANLQQATSILEQALGADDAARLDLERTTIRAPIAGHVGQRTVRIGQYAETGMPLMAIVPDAIYVIANYKETQLDRIRPGQPVEITIDALGGLILSGRVESFAPASGAQFALLPPDNATGNFTKIVQRIPLRIRIDAEQARMNILRPGMSVESVIDTRDIAR